MSEERKNARDKLTDSTIIFTENDHFWGGGKLNQHSSMSEENIKKKAEMATFFSRRTQFQLIGGLVIHRI